MTLVIDVRVKFRAWFVTFGTVERTFRFPVPDVAMFFANEIISRLKMDERGVKVSARIE